MNHVHGRIAAVMALALVAAGCAGPQACREPSREERLAAADCRQREVTRMVYGPGGCQADAYAIGKLAVERCWAEFDQRQQDCLSDDQRDASRAAAQQAATDDALAGQRQLRDYGQCLAAPR
jgi:hypothetical protein